MNAIILCAGRGTRLQSVIGDMPKPAIKFGDHTLLQRIVIELLRLDTVSNIYINVSASAKVLLSNLQISKELPRVRILYEASPWGPSLTVFETLKLSNEGLLVVHGDLLLEAKAINKFISSVTESEDEKSFVAVHRRQSVHSSQEIRIGKSGLVEEILWKEIETTHTASPVKSGEEFVFVDSGLYFFASTSLNFLQSPQPGSGVSTGLLPQLIDKHLLYAIPWKGMRFPIDTSSKLLLANEAFTSYPNKFKL